MISFGLKPQPAHTVWVKMDNGQSVHRRAVRFPVKPGWFRHQGMVY